MSNRIEPSYLCEVQKNTSKIRNFCILAHVDHGKTTLSDSLVSSNGIISAKLAGKLRFMDSTEEEQKRGITMHSSAISLLYDLEDRKKGDAANDSSEPALRDEYLINLVDSPGHIDFSSDVSTATRLCDGALIVVDVLEGVCTQTHAVLYKALKERMRPCLVLNKIDRLLIDMRLSTVEAFQHLRRLVEHVNALAFTLLNSELMKREQDGELSANSSNNAATQGAKDSNSTTASASNDEEEEDPLVAEWYFSPEKGNVVFTGALDCWGFGLLKFANLWAKELGVNRNVLRKYLFEDYSYNTVTKKIVKCDPNSSEGSRPMFASMVLDPIWKIYELALVNNEPEKAAKMAHKRFGIELPPREINPRDPRATVQSIFRRWMPLSDAVLRMVVRAMPSPIEAQQRRLFTLLPGISETDCTVMATTTNSSTSNGGDSCGYISTAVAAAGDIDKSADAVRDSLQWIKSSVAACDARPEAPLVVFISKMAPVRVAELSPRDIALLNQQLRDKAASSGDPDAVPETLKHDGEVFMALARVYSGVIRRDSELYVISHRHDPLCKTTKQSQSTAAEDGIAAIDLEDNSSHGESNGDNTFDAAAVDVHGAVPDHMSSMVTRVPGGSVGMYIMLGPSVFPTEEVTAGNIVGIVGLEGHVLKTATLSSSWACHPMKAITFQAKPMVQVAVEPLSYADLKKLEHGLQMLYQFDPVVEIGVDDSGQHTMVCLGELHLEQCIKALTERFAKCEVKVSEPLISFRETVLHCESATAQPVLPPPWSDLHGLDATMGGTARLVMGTDNLAITFRCFPLPAGLTQQLERDVSASLSAEASLADLHRVVAKDGIAAGAQFLSQNKAVDAFWKDAVKAIRDGAEESDEAIDSCVSVTAKEGASEADLVDLASRVVSIGPHKNTNNLLLLSPSAVVDVFPFKVPPCARRSKGAASEGLTTSAVEEGNGLLNSAPLASITLKTQGELFHKVWSRLSSSVVAGFQVTAASGPLMHEPLHGVGFAVERIEVNRAICATSLSAGELSLLLSSTTTTNTAAVAATTALDQQEESMSLTSNDTGSAASTVLTGQLISEVKETLYLAMLSCPVRVVEPIYQCDLQCDQMQVGNLYGVLSKRRGVVTKEDIIEGTSLFLLSAHLPVANSFGFAQELLKKTSGAGTAPQLSFSHWQVNAVDPFWRPTTEEELEEFGEIAAAEHNLSRTFIDAVRKRKGLAIEEKIVAFGEKQRTLSRKK